MLIKAEELQENMIHSKGSMLALFVLSKFLDCKVSINLYFAECVLPVSFYDFFHMTNGISNCM